MTTRRAPPSRLPLGPPAAALAAAAPAAVAQESPDDPVFLSSPEMEGAGLPFSEAVRVGEMLYLSGQVGLEPGTTRLVEGGIRAEARRTLENIRTTLERHGSSMDRLVKCTVMLADIEEWGAFNEVWVTFFDERYPARSAFGADGLALGARVEIDCMAAAGGG